MLMSSDGRTVAATNRNRLGENHRNAAYFIDAIRANSTVFSVIEREVGGYRFTYSRRIVDTSGLLGVIVIEVDLHKFERAWAGVSDAVHGHRQQGQYHPRHRGALARVDEGEAVQAADTRERHSARHSGHRRLEHAAPGCLSAGGGGDAVGKPGSLQRLAD